MEARFPSARIGMWGPDDNPVETGVLEMHAHALAQDSNWLSRRYQVQFLAEWVSLNLDGGPRGLLVQQIV